MAHVIDKHKALAYLTDAIDRVKDDRMHQVARDMKALKKKHGGAFVAKLKTASVVLEKHVLVMEEEMGKITTAKNAFNKRAATSGGAEARSVSRDRRARPHEISVSPAP